MSGHDRTGLFFLMNTPQRPIDIDSCHGSEVPRPLSSILDIPRQVRALLWWGETKPFRIASVSSNTNSFGLTGIILVAQDGEAWEVAKSLHCEEDKATWVKDNVVHVPLRAGTGQVLFSLLSVELPRRLPNAPVQVIREIWNL